jgi:hypothetical protein
VAKEKVLNGPSGSGALVKRLLDENPTIPLPV